jgi:NAD+ synthase (glutamine-hydrolysing)
MRPWSHILMEWLLTLLKKISKPRLRGLILMAWSNKFGAILLNTSNKSETAVGYSTLYGDMCGGFSSIGDLYKTQVYEMCDFINRNAEVIPNHVLTKSA